MADPTARQERIARALCRADNGNPDADWPPATAGDLTPAPKWRFYLPQALAAETAYPEPS